MDTTLIEKYGLSKAGQQHVAKEFDFSDYVDTVRVEFEDGSCLILNSANLWVDERISIIQTEHCGDYVIPHGGTLLIEKLPKFRPSPIELSTDLLAPGYKIYTEAELSGDEEAV